MGRVGRPSKPYRTSWGEDVSGLTRCADGRWRIASTEQRFSESDERLAVSKAKAIIAAENPLEKVEVKATVPFDAAHAAIDRWESTHRESGKRFIYHADRRDFSAQYEVDPAVVWPWLRELLIADPAYVARMVGLPTVARIHDREKPPAEAVKVTELVKHYKASNPSGPKAKRRTVSVFEAFGKYCGAKTLDDLTIPKLLAYRESIETSKTVLSGGTRKWTFGQVKCVIAYGLKVGIDEVQINAALSRCKVLWTATPDSPVNPQPISRDDFHKLLNAATPDWRAWLLMGLNCACYIEELIGIRWSEIDLDHGTYATIRNKTKADRVPRAATLWPETIAALNALRRGPVHVFTSKLGVAYTSSASRCNKFAKLRAKAGVDASVGFSMLKDGAYTTACRDQPDDRLARVLAGHRAAGLQDNYVLRDPAMVRPACDAVYRHYFG